jgi:hypothetical protein
MHMHIYMHMHICLKFSRSSTYTHPHISFARAQAEVRADFDRIESCYKSERAKAAQEKAAQEKNALQKAMAYGSGSASAKHSPLDKLDKLDQGAKGVVKGHSELGAKREEQRRGPRGKDAVSDEDCETPPLGSPRFRTRKREVSYFADVHAVQPLSRAEERRQLEAALKKSRVRPYCVCDGCHGVCVCVIVCVCH